MPWVAIALVAAAAVGGAISAVKSSDAAQDAAQENYNRAKAKEDQVRYNTAQDLNATNTNNVKTLGSVRASYAASGVEMTGSATDVFANDQDILHNKLVNIQQRGNFQIAGLENEANQAQKQRLDAISSKPWAIAGSLLAPGMNLASTLSSKTPAPGGLTDSGGYPIPEQDLQ